MSRYLIDAHNPDRYVHVGWSNAMQSYFGQVYDPFLPPDEQLVVWVSGAQVPVQTVEALQARLVAHCTIPPQVCAQLEADRAQSTVPTRLQRDLAQLFGGEEGLDALLWQLRASRN